MFEATGSNRKKCGSAVLTLKMPHKACPLSVCPLFSFLSISLTPTHVQFFLLELALEMMWLDGSKGSCLFFFVRQLVTGKSVNQVTTRTVHSSWPTSSYEWFPWHSFSVSFILAHTHSKPTVHMLSIKPPIPQMLLHRSVFAWSDVLLFLSWPPVKPVVTYLCLNQ